jgi:hypothetical protein
MPNWSNQVPARDKSHGFDLVRTPADGTFQAIVTSEDLIGCFTHYWGGRTVPCEGDPCPACEKLQSSRWHGYLSCFNPRTREHVLFEFTQKAAFALAEYRDAHGTLRGCHFQAFRPKRRKNSRVVIECKPADLTKITLPKPPDLVRAMSTIWQLPATAFAPDKAVDSHSTLSTKTEPLDEMRGNGKPPRKIETLLQETNP